MNLKANLKGRSTKILIPYEPICCCTVSYGIYTNNKVSIYTIETLLFDSKLYDKMILFCCCSIVFLKSSSPANFHLQDLMVGSPVGLELTTTRLTAACSINWAKEDYSIILLFSLLAQWRTVKPLHVGLTNLSDLSVNIPWPSAKLLKIFPKI